MGEGQTAHRRLEAEVPVAEYVRECVDIPKFLTYCRVCGNYGARWSCPPFDFDPAEIWARFKTLRLVACVLVPELGQSAEAALRALEALKEDMLEELLALEKSEPGSLALAMGTCRLCGERCAKQEGAPCRHPDRMRHSIESLGGDVTRTAERYFHLPLLWIQNGVLPEYLTLVGGLLL